MLGDIVLCVDYSRLHVQENFEETAAIKERCGCCACRCILDVATCGAAADMPIHFTVDGSSGPVGVSPCATRCPYGTYLVDPASSHMLVSKTKPCMSKYKHFCTVKLRMAH